MNKSGLIELLSDQTNMTKTQADEIIDVVFDTMTEALIKGERIEIRRFGSFVVKQYDGYIGRNPRTGEKVQVPSKQLPVFKVGKELKKRVDQGATTSVADNLDADLFRRL